MHIVLVVVGFLWPWWLVAACVPHPAHSPVSSISPTTETGVDLANMLNARAFLDESLLVITWEQYSIYTCESKSIPLPPPFVCTYYAVIGRGKKGWIPGRRNSNAFIFRQLCFRPCNQNVWVGSCFVLSLESKPTNQVWDAILKGLVEMESFHWKQRNVIFLGLQTACTIISDSVVFRDVVGGP